MITNTYVVKRITSRTFRMGMMITVCSGYIRSTVPLLDGTLEETTSFLSHVQIVLNFSCYKGG